MRIYRECGTALKRRKDSNAGTEDRYRVICLEQKKETNSCCEDPLTKCCAENKPTRRILADGPKKGIPIEKNNWSWIVEQ
jgi:hypothetical protein